MAALEYLTTNSLTSYPFKLGREIGENTQHPIADDWFYDILFVSFSSSIRSVFISKIKKTSSGELEISLSSTENLSLLDTAIISSNLVVNHYKNSAKSFASYSTATFAVKFVLGPGLVDKSAFEQTYTLKESELANSAIVLNSPRLNTLTFEAYNFDPSVVGEVNVDHIHTYSYPSVPVVKPNYNSQFTLDSLNTGSLYVTRGAGAGLYDPCPQPGEIQDVYSLNSTTPDSKGAIFLKPSSCYTANTLTPSGETLYGNLLDKYKTFEVLSLDGEVLTKNVVVPGHSITFENFCKPKCPRENLNAFAHYLNRVSDGAQELDYIVSRSTETRGKGSSTLKVFTASAFCVEDDNIFARCNDPENADSYIDCGDKFIKNYHEGRTLQIYYTSLVVRNYKIVDVIDNNTVRLDNIPPPATQQDPLLSFRVLDNGVISNLNCAALSYNQNAANFLKTYFTVNYATNDAYNQDGVYCTNVAVVVSAFNPSPEQAQIQISFSPTLLERVSNFKVRTADSLYTLEIPELTLGCRQYASLETVFSLPCATSGGQLIITVSEKVGNVWLPIGENYNLPEINAVECPGTSSGGAVIKRRVTQQNWEDFYETITLPADITGISDIYGNPPGWIEFNLDSNILAIQVSNYPDTATSQRYNLYFRSFGLATFIWQLVLDYVAYPEIISPLTSRFSENTPLILSKETVYTEDNPALQIFATNMIILSSDFNDDEETYYYSISAGALPTGLTLNASSGKITGQINASVDSGTLFEAVLTARNAAGNATNPQAISFSVAVEAPPIISLIAPPENETYNISNLDNFTLAAPLVSFNVLNTPIYNFVLTGDLPLGLYFNAVTGTITGKVTETTPDSVELFVHTDNVYGQSNVISFTINYTIFDKPAIITPTDGQVFEVGVSDLSTLASPLFTVSALQAYGGTDNYAVGLTDTTRNHYLAAGIPPGFTLDYFTGKFYGKISEGSVQNDSALITYTIRLGAYNPIGSVSRNIFLRVFNSKKPVISDSTQGISLFVAKNTPYTTSKPLHRFTALNNPTSFTVLNLPTGLSCDAAGKITGTVLSGVAAGEYSLIVSASNAYGESNQITCHINVPLSLVSPITANGYVVEINTEYTNLFEVASCAVVDGETVNIAVTDLPDGFVFADGFVSGTTTALGLHIVKITLTSLTQKTVTTSVKITVVSEVFSISGTVRDSDGSPVENILVTDGQGKTAITKADGKYSLSGFFSGSYNIAASSNIYSLIPSFRKVDLSTSDSIDADFIAETATRLIKGFIFDETFAGVRGVVVSDGAHEATTDSFGVYELYATTQATAITPISENYVFTPLTVNIVADTESIEGANFSAIKSKATEAPTIDSILSGNKELTVSFNPPADSGGTAITNYQYSLNGGEHWNDVTPAKITSPITITSGYFGTGVADLVNGTSYNIRIRAINLSGPGAPSITFKATPATVPPKPTIISHLVGSSAASVSFTSPINDSGAAILYFEYSLDGGLTYSQTDNQDSPLVIPNLILGNSYNLKIRAVNSQGFGETSEAYTLVMADAPSPPTITSITPQNGKLVVYFTGPASDGGVALINIGYSTDNGGTYTYRDPQSLTSPVTIEELENGVFYSVRLKAVNSVYNYSFDSQAVVAAPVAPPAAPTNLTVAGSDKALIINFTAPAASTTVIQNYEYQLDGGSWTPANPQIAGSPIRIPNLINGQQYSVKLRAITAYDTGAESIAILGTPAKPAEAPVITSITPGNTTLSVLFTKTTDFGGSTFVAYEYSKNAGTSYETVTITDEPNAKGSFTITGLINGRRYSILLRARTTTGPGNSSTSMAGTPRTVPSAPTQLSSVSGNRYANISFLAPSDNGGASISNYKYQINGGEWLARTPTSTTLTLNLKNLVNGDLYSVKLRAVNAAGDGEESLATTFIPKTTPTAPSISKIYGSSKKLQIIFNSPISTGGAPITFYEYSLDGGESFSVAAQLNTGASLNDPQEYPYIILDNLINGHTYNVSLRASNSVGTGPSSTAKEGTPIGAPPAPKLIKASGSATGAIVYFNPPATSGGANITNYQYSAAALGASDSWTPAQPTTLNSPLTVPNLTVGNKYLIKLRAVNTYGAGDESESTIVFIGVPDAPIITGIRESSEKLTVFFNPPLNQGASAVTNYIYSLEDDGIYFQASETSSPIVISSLVNETSYKVRIIAMNSAGQSSPSNIVEGTPTATPSKPTITSIISRENELYVYFIPPENDAGSPVNDYKYSTDDGNTYIFANKATSPLKIANLTQGNSYKVTLKAVNSNGDGKESDPYTITVGSPAPPEITSVSASSTEVAISYIQVEDGGSPVLNYEYSLNGSSTWTPLNPASTEGELKLTTQLTNNTRYTFRLRAINANGAGEPSSPANIAKNLGYIPEISEILPGNNTVSLKILPPPNSAQPVTSYKYVIGNLERSVPASTTGATELTISNLVNGQVYTISQLVATFESALDTLPLENIVFTPGTPSAPTGLSIAPGNQTLTISFTPPSSDGGYPITTYKYYLRTQIADMVIDGIYDFNAPDTTSPVTITGLTNDSVYTVALLADNQTGTGVMSAKLNATPIAQVPSAPTIQKIAAGNESLTVSFSPPVTDGGRTISSYKYSVNNGATKIAYNNTTGPIEIENLTNGTTYTVVIYAVNSVGTGEASLAVQATPAAGKTPTAPKISSIVPGIRQLTAYFTPPTSDGGEPITRYQYKLNDGQWLTRIPNESLDSPITVTKLLSSTSYKIKLRALNSAGHGASSIAASAKTPISPPGISKITQLSIPNISTISLAFIGPDDDGGSPILKYEYTFNQDPNVTYFRELLIADLDYYNPATKAGGKELVFTPDLVIPGTGYYVVVENFKIRAINAAGPSEWSEDVSATQDPEGFPLKAPTILEATVLSATSVEILFEPPYYIGSPPITGYEYSASTSGLAIYSSPVEAPDNKITITGLTPGSTYRIKIRAYNTQKNATPSEEITITTLPDVPSAPTITNINGLNQQLAIYFLPPFTPGGTIIDYEYSLNGGSYVSGATVSSPITINGTTNFVNYAVTIRAVNQVGPGIQSNTVTGVSGSPSAPIITHIFPDNVNTTGKTLLVYFNPPSSNGGSPITKYLYSTDGGSSFSEVLSSYVLPNNGFVISGLTNGQVYDVVLKAENLFGLGEPSEKVTAKPYCLASAPKLTAAVTDTTQLGVVEVTFTPPTDTGGSPILGYSYSTNSGKSWQPTVPNNNKIIISTPTVAGTSPPVILRAITDAGPGKESNSLNVYPITVPWSPYVTLIKSETSPTAELIINTGDVHEAAPTTHLIYTIYINNSGGVETLIPVTTNTVRIPVTNLEYGDFVTATAQAINFTDINSQNPITQSSGISKPGSAQPIHLGPPTLVMPRDWAKVTEATYYPSKELYSTTIVFYMPTKANHEYVGSDIKSMKPLGLGLFVERTYAGAVKSGAIKNVTTFLTGGLGGVSMFSDEPVGDTQPKITFSWSRDYEDMLANRYKLIVKFERFFYRYEPVLFRVASFPKPKVISSEIALRFNYAPQMSMEAPSNVYNYAKYPGSLIDNSYLFKIISGDTYGNLKFNASYDCNIVEFLVSLYSGSLLYFIDSDSFNVSSDGERPVMLWESVPRHTGTFITDVASNFWIAEMVNSSPTFSANVKQLISPYSSKTFEYFKRITNYNDEIYVLTSSASGAAQIHSFNSGLLFSNHNIPNKYSKDIIVQGNSVFLLSSDSILKVTNSSTLVVAEGLFEQASAMVMDSLSNIYVTEGSKHIIKKLVYNNNEVYTLVVVYAGVENSAGIDNGFRTSAKFSNPSKLCINANDEICVSDSRSIRHISSSGEVSTIVNDVYNYLSYLYPTQQLFRSYVTQPNYPLPIAFSEPNAMSLYTVLENTHVIEILHDGLYRATLNVASLTMSGMQEATATKDTTSNKTLPFCLISKSPDYSGTKFYSGSSASPPDPFFPPHVYIPPVDDTTQNTFFHLTTLTVVGVRENSRTFINIATDREGFNLSAEKVPHTKFADFSKIQLITRQSVTQQESVALKEVLWSPSFKPAITRIFRDYDIFGEYVIRYTVGNSQTVLSLTQPRENFRSNTIEQISPITVKNLIGRTTFNTLTGDLHLNYTGAPSRWLYRYSVELYSPPAGFTVFWKYKHELSTEWKALLTVNPDRQAVWLKEFVGNIPALEQLYNINSSFGALVYDRTTPNRCTAYIFTPLSFNLSVASTIPFDDLASLLKLEMLIASEKNINGQPSGKISPTIPIPVGSLSPGMNPASWTMNLWNPT